MNRSHMFRNCIVLSLIVGVGALGCSDNLAGTPGAGGASTSGGSSGGGASGVGGSTSGGSSGVGGASTNGGSSSGASGVGGSTSGGSSGAGGSSGSGAVAGSGGSSGSGAAAGSGGSSGSGAAAGSGGSSGSGAAAGSGGSSGGSWNEGTELKAFPTAQGYGRLAKGGRGGRVIKVTTLADSGTGSLRAAVEATGPRTVVFDIGGTIRLSSKLQIKAANKELTIAGQTAPGNGITIRDYAFGTTGSEDLIIRFIRTRVGSSSGQTQDGMGLTASNNAIMDHCSISWTIDEGFSSRQAHNITLQRTLISECLNDAGHVIQMSPHGYAASINGDIGSFHRNLLAHCVGRNWSMAGGLEGGTPTLAIGRLDIRNNVVYNWKDRTTDGEIFQVNFVNNYYKPGPASDREWAISLEFYEIAENDPKYYIAGNVMPGFFTANEVSKSYHVPTTPPGDYLASQQLWEPHVETVTAEQAYADVLSDVGANVPMLDEHDRRIIEEVRNGTYTYSGSLTGLPGHIDNEADAGGHQAFPTVMRPAGWDTDNDGMPNTWELAHGLNPNDAEDRNGTNLSRLGYTNLEMYLNELAGDFD